MHVLIFGLGYCGRAVARDALDAGWAVTATSRAAAAGALPGLRVVPFDDARAEIADATHVLVTAPPGPDGDPVLARYASALRESDMLAWIGYLSTTGVFGDRDGAWVDEDTAPAPAAERSKRRLAAELAWREVAGSRPLDLFRLAGIYGPGRSALDDVRSGRARRVICPGHCFGRIHRDDIAAGVLAAMARPGQGARVLNFSDDEPAESAAVIEEAARLLGLEPPPSVAFADAYDAMSDMARSFWAERRLVSSRRTQAALGLTWRYKNFRDGLRAILVEEQADLVA